MITDNFFLKLVNHNLGKYYDGALKTILFILMEPHTKNNMRNTFWLKHHEVWEEITDVLEEQSTFI